jgi:oxygen-independent coproporphyrinogen-3 oxidase
VALQPAHLSHYHLTLEPNTMFASRPPAGLPDADVAWDMQDECVAAIEAAGYGQYEVSAYARPGRQCAHNLNYWKYGDYLGIGAGAHGKLSTGSDANILRRWKPKNPTGYMQAAGPAEGIGGEEHIAPDARPFDYMLNALRLVDGFSLRDFEVRTGLPRAAIRKELDHAVLSGWLAVDGDRVVPTEFGRRFTNDVFGLFL